MNLHFKTLSRPFAYTSLLVLLSTPWWLLSSTGKVSALAPSDKIMTASPRFDLQAMQCKVVMLSATKATVGNGWFRTTKLVQGCSIFIIVIDVLYMIYDNFFVATEFLSVFSNQTDGRDLSQILLGNAGRKCMEMLQEFHVYMSSWGKSELEKSRMTAGIADNWGLSWSFFFPSCFN